MRSEGTTDETGSEQGEKKEEEELVPLKAVEEQRTKRESAERRAAEAEGYIKGAQAAAAAQPTQTPAPKELTHAELRQAVEAQQMTEAEADQIRDHQIERRVEEKVAKRTETKIETQAIADRTSAEMARYREIIPELADQTSDTIAKVHTEFQNLISLGFADDARTELIAVRSAFGDVSKLEKIGGEKVRETHQETGGGREPGAEGGPRNDGWPKEMSADSRAYYQDQINQGIFADRKAALEEFNYKPKHQPRSKRAA